MDGLQDALLVIAFAAAAAALAVAFLALRLAGGRDRARPATPEQDLVTTVAARTPEETDLRRLSERIAALEVRSRAGGGAVSVGLGLVRFNAFDDTGGNQSFALALLDASRDGIVLSSLHSRQTTRLYIKHISNGTPDSPLSDEESRALQQAGLQQTPEA
jgi:hypothetical protein